MPGVHSDLGGGYLPRMRENMFITRPQVETLPLNQPGEQSRVYQQTMAQLPVVEGSPAMMPLIRTNPITPEVWSDEYASVDRYGQMQKRSFAALTLRHRIVKNDWSKVALRVMVDAAREAGVLFEDIEKKNGMEIPTELLPFCKRARAMGNAVRRKRPVAGFSTEELDIIAKNYIHCSANWNAVTLNQAGELHGGASAFRLIDFVNRPDNEWVRTIYNMDGEKR